MAQSLDARRRGAGLQAWQAARLKHSIRDADWMVGIASLVALGAFWVLIVLVWGWLR